MHSSQKRKPAQRVVVEVEEHIQISDSKVVFFSQFVSFVWTLENFYVLAQLLPLLWSLISLGHKQVLKAMATGWRRRFSSQQHHCLFISLPFSEDCKILYCSFTTFCLSFTPSSFAAPLSLVTGAGGMGCSQRCRYSYIYRSIHF